MDVVFEWRYCRSLCEFFSDDIVIVVVCSVLWFPPVRNTHDKTMG